MPPHCPRDRNVRLIHGQHLCGDLRVEDCSGCGLAGCGWNDNAYGTGALGPLVLFQTDGTHRLHIQSREDGLSIDQIVLSPHNYIDTAPGRTKNDTTIVMR